MLNIFVPGSPFDIKVIMASGYAWHLLIDGARDVNLVRTMIWYEKIPYETVRYEMVRYVRSGSKRFDRSCILRLHYVPGGHGSHVSDNRDKNGINVRQRRGPG